MTAVEREQDLAAKILAVHRPWYEVGGERRDHTVMIADDELPNGHVCRTGDSDACDAEYGEHHDLACVECRQIIDGEVPGYLLWPCTTAKMAMQAAALDPSEAALIAAEMLLNAHGYVVVERASLKPAACGESTLSDSPDPSPESAPGRSQSAPESLDGSHG